MHSVSRITPRDRPLSVLSADSANIDHVIYLEDNPELALFAESLGCKPGGKKALTREQFETLDHFARPYIRASYPGGSSANLLVMIKAVMGDQAKAVFLGAVADDEDGLRIKQAFRKAGVALKPQAAPSQPAIEGATSYVMIYPGGARTTITYPGNARDVVEDYYVRQHPDALEKLVHNADLVVIQGTMPLKMGWDLTDRMETLRRQYHKKLCYALPTNPGFTFTHFDYVRE